ncbi:hypothetical protein ACFSGX_06670 [Sphingomonas arantia]|uniref:Lipoprotein n=1 Tax=Sphingomonas arantia TaxID=1460676 RepID=A0ABW4TWJ0_9SPHN
MIGLVALLAATACTSGSEFEPPLCPAQLPAVAEIRIEEQGATLWKTTGEPPCADFRPTLADVRSFFRGAKSADRRDVHYTLSESGCVARGAVRFADGSRGRWQVDRFALGWLDRAGRPRLTLYCPQCHRRPWRQ